MKILQLLTKRQYRGAEVAAATFSQEFIALGHTIIFAGLYAPPEESLHVDGALNVDIHARKTFFSITGFFRLLKLIKQEKPDILHANGSDTLKYLIAIKVVRPSSIVIYRNISVISHWRGTNPFKNAFYNFLFRKTNFVTSVGDTSRADLMKTFEYPEQKIAVIKRGIKIPVKVESRADQKIKLGIPPDKLVLIHVGNFSPEKNHAFLIDSFIRIKQTGLPVTLLLAGEGLLLNEIRDKVKSLKLEQDVIFLGLVPDISPYLATADLIVLTSKVEGVPGVLLEAAAHNVPAVALNVGGVSESVLHGETGVLVSEEDTGLFSTEVTALLKDESTRRRLGENAWRFVKENYDLNTGARKFIGIFEGLLNKT